MSWNGVQGEGTNQLTHSLQTSKVGVLRYPRVIDSSAGLDAFLLRQMLHKSHDFDVIFSSGRIPME